MPTENNQYNKPRNSTNGNAPGGGDSKDESRLDWKQAFAPKSWLIEKAGFVIGIAVGFLILGALLFIGLASVVNEVSTKDGLFGDSLFRSFLIMGSILFVIVVILARKTVLSSRTDRLRNEQILKMVDTMPLDPNSEWDRRVERFRAACNAMKRNFLMVSAVFLVVLLFLLVTIGFWNSVLTVPYIFLFFSCIGCFCAAFAGPLFWVRKPYTKEEYVQTMVLPQLKNIFQELDFQPDRSLNEQIIKDAKIVKQGRRYIYTGKNYISGKYRGISFQQSEIKISGVPSGGKGSNSAESSDVYFDGRWLVLDIHKTIKSDFYVWSSNFANADKDSKLQLGMQRVQLEDYEFNRIFLTLASVPHDAFYILTPAVIDRLKALTKTSAGRQMLQGVAMYCSGNVMHIAVNQTGESFAPGIMYPSEQAAKAKVVGDIALITDTIDSVIYDYKRGG